MVSSMQIYDRYSLIDRLKNVFVSEIELKSDRIPAAVMLILHFRYSRPYIILIKRSKHLHNHASQISFPGGIREGNEEFIDTAIRETEEELGLKIDKNDIIGMMKSVDTITSNFSIVPFIAIVDDITTLRVNRDEIDEVIDADLIKLLSTRSIDDRYNSNNHYKFEYEKHLIWGATARILDSIYHALK